MSDILLVGFLLHMWMWLLCRRAGKIQGELKRIADALEWIHKCQEVLCNEERKK